MFRTFAIAAVCLLAACESMPSTGSPLSPARVAKPATAPAPEGPAVPDAPLDPNSPFIEDQLFDAPPDPEAEPSGADVLFRNQLQAPEVAPEPEPGPPPVAVEPAPAPPPMPAWDGTTPPDGAGSWGIALLATLLDVQPPRAVVALPDGSERVVQPGTFLPDHRLVVLAVGRDAIQIAHIEPMGWNSRVQTHTLRSLFQP